jgi:uncharacterized protein (TIGR00369 family)
MDFDPDLPWRIVKGDGFNAHIGPIRFARVAEGEWRSALVLDARHINVGGVCHGGVVMALADVTMGTATFEAGPSHPCATIQMDCHFLAAAKESQTLLGRARQMRRVRELSFMECELWSGGRQVMRASGVWKYLASRAPGQSGP